ncbi:MAG: hypothetical protein KKH70_15980 [Gammaproteobacteria bacterium]|nr:hypothetical protein [Gammaproteobacteria bacterium]MBU2059591.1 hypothetical protein [Gammaproteobacteria bacterium]MBU2248063.1 hypothetical protein [Gammaproteobacteria bacterium]MBU2394832.1 hypothetical protein [Gammaproteobacteria bacterium]MBU2684090.1 hypothetical protein [Gammaproteobacteria bacterium]
MSKSKKFKLLLLVEIGLIIAFKFQVVSFEDFYLNPFYIAGMILGCYLMLAGVLYFCPHCNKHQIIKKGGIGLPSDTCWQCGKSSHVI